MGVAKGRSRGHRCATSPPTTVRAGIRVNAISAGPIAHAGRRRHRRMPVQSSPARPAQCALAPDRRHRARRPVSPLPALRPVQQASPAKSTMWTPAYNIASMPTLADAAARRTYEQARQISAGDASAPAGQDHRLSIRRNGRSAYLLCYWMKVRKAGTSFHWEW